MFLRACRWLFGGACYVYIAGTTIYTSQKIKGGKQVYDSHADVASSIGAMSKEEFDNKFDKQEQLANILLKKEIEAVTWYLDPNIPTAGPLHLTGPHYMERLETVVAALVKSNPQKSIGRTLVLELNKMVEQAWYEYYRTHGVFATICKAMKSPPSLQKLGKLFAVESLYSVEEYREAMDLLEEVSQTYAKQDKYLLCLCGMPDSASVYIPSSESSSESNFIFHPWLSTRPYPASMRLVIHSNYTATAQHTPNACWSMTSKNPVLCRVMIGTACSSLDPEDAVKLAKLVGGNMTAKTVNQLVKTEIGLNYVDWLDIVNAGGQTEQVLKKRAKRSDDQLVNALVMHNEACTFNNAGIGSRNHLAALLREFAKTGKVVVSQAMLEALGPDADARTALTIFIGLGLAMPIYDDKTGRLKELVMHRPCLARVMQADRASLPWLY